MTTFVRCASARRAADVLAGDDLCAARDWAEQVITEMSMFPAGRFSDLTDSSSQGLKYLRDVGLAQSDDEVQEEKIVTVMHRPRPRPLYPC
jgi:phage terminase large subunit-like protein